MRSALAQDYGRIELLISDNASPNPEVQRVGSRHAASDPRVRYVRQPRNNGHAANYQWLLEQAKGHYFMWLADDDWLDPQYVTSCMSVLTDDRTTILVCGLARYYRDGVNTLDERGINLDSRRPGVRVIRYFARVSLNGPMFGIARREDLLRTGFPATIGGDWLLIATLAARGRVRTLESVHIHRSASGLGADSRHLAYSFGMRGIAARYYHVAVATSTWREIARGAFAFGDMRRIPRLCVAGTVAALILTRFTLASLVREVLGPRKAAFLERHVSAWLRRREYG